MRNHMWRYSFHVLRAFCMIFIFFAPSWGSEWEVSPYVTVRGEYNDNILFDPDEKKLDDMVTRVRPRVEGRYGTERLDFSLDLGLEWEKYLDYAELDTVDHDHYIALSYALSRTLILSTGAYFRKDTTLEAELLETGLLVHRREDRRRFGGDLGFVYDVSHRLSCSGEWSRGYGDYPDDPDRRNDYQEDAFGLAPRYVLSPATTLFLNMAYTETVYDKEGIARTVITNYNIIPSLRHDFAEDFYVSGGVGYSYSEQKTKDEESGGFAFDLRIHGDWKKGSIELLANRYQYSTYYRRSADRSRLTLRGTYRLSHRFSSSLSASYYINRFSGYNDNEYFTVYPSFNYIFTPSVRLRGSVGYSRYEYEDRSDRDRLTATLEIRFGWPRLLSGH